MALPQPKMDERDFDQLLADARRRIPRFTPEWTDFNDSDPGMTLVQLFAWFTDTMLWQMRRVPDLHYVKFLELVGLKPEPAIPARAMVRFDLNPKLAARPKSIPAHATSEIILIQNDDGEQKRVVFETTEDLALVQAELKAVRRRAPGQVTATSEDTTALNQPLGKGFRPFGPDGLPASELLLGFRALDAEASAVEVFPEIWQLHLQLVEAERRRPLTRHVGIDPEHTPPPPARAGELRWFALVDEQEREPLPVVEDGTAGMASSGYLRLKGPRRAAAFSLDGKQDPYFWVACRVERAFDIDRAPRLQLISTNAVNAEARSTFANELVTIVPGVAKQVVSLANGPVEPGSLRLTVDGELWQKVDDLSVAKADAKVYTLDEASGEIGFGGDGNGQLPGEGSEIRATYRAGGGKAGNISAQQLRIPWSGVTGTNPFPASAGKDAEDLEALKSRAPGRLRHLDRAVTADDYETIARGEGGMGRAQAYPGRHPDYPDVIMPQALTLVVVPPLTVPPDGIGQAYQPVPSEPEMDQLVDALTERRTLGCELFVRPARPLKVRVAAKVQPRPGLTPGQVVAQGRAALNAWLNAADRGIGGQIRAVELWAELARSPAVTAVIDLTVEFENQRLRLTDPARGLDWDQFLWGVPDHAIEPTTPSRGRRP